jgi:hypothetical protein
VFGAMRQPTRAARLLGAAEALRAVIHSPLAPAEQSDHKRKVSEVRAQLPESAFNVAWAEGRGMSMEQAIVYALEQ